MVEDLEEIHEFLELAKSSVKKGIALEQKFDGFCVAHDVDWTRYRVIDAPVRCQIPEDISEVNELPECARHCWKLLMFRRKPQDVEESVKFLLPLLKTAEIKSFKHNGNAKTGAVPPYVIVIYTWGIEEREQLKAKLHSIGFKNIPYRKGCKAFEKRFGHWKHWFKE